MGDSNYEWVELIATDNINFAQKPYTVFFSNNGTATSKGWVEGQIPTPPPRNSTYAFLINSGSVSPGDVVYVGGSLMEPSGIKLRVKSTATEPGDGGIGGAFTGASGVLGNGGGVADGVAVFNKHVSQIDSNTVPVDAIFFGTGIGGAAMADTTRGFTLPVNDRYTGGKLKTRSFLAPEILTFYSIKASGTYNRSTGIYTTPRTWTTNTSAWTSSTSNISLTGNTYLWSNGATTKNISNLAAGTYTVTVTTSACSSTFSYTVPQASQLQVGTTSSQASCQTATDGSITSSVSGGVPPYSYQWS
ncbi:MAG: SprB repeat-containing protein, partial [Bacteroidota bacterium]